MGFGDSLTYQSVEPKPGLVIGCPSFKQCLLQREDVGVLPAWHERYHCLGRGDDGHRQLRRAGFNNPEEGFFGSAGSGIQARVGFIHRFGSIVHQSHS